VQHQTINPIWNEYFKFNVTNEAVFKTTKTLYFYIYNYAHSSRPECIGEAQLRLTSQTLHTGGDLWCSISKQRAVKKKKFSKIRKTFVVFFRLGR
jgi:Ca2+-dependent lipid-binding protein